MIKNGSLVSIIVPIYNLESSLATCLDSVFSQTYVDIEVILVDDGSSDRSLNICHEYAKKDKRVKVIHQTNKGVSAARNAGLNSATGFFITFADGDDLLKSDAIESMVLELQITGAEAVRTTYETVRNGITQHVKRNIKIGLYVDNSLNKVIRSVAIGEIMGYVWVLMIRRDALPGLVRFPTNIHMMEDAYFLINLLKNIKSIFISDKVTYTYFLRDTSASRSIENIHRNIEDILKVNKIFTELLAENRSSFISNMNATHVLAILGQFTATGNLKTYNTVNKFIQILNNDINFMQLLTETRVNHLSVYGKVSVLAANYHSVFALFIIFNARVVFKNILSILSKSTSSSDIKLDNNDVDFVITWVDGGDKQWLEKKETHSHVETIKSDIDNSAKRYRDWENLQYLFRGIENFTPWVRTIHFVTEGHLPTWLDTSNVKLHIVKHEDYIPEKYLPTFSSHPIEINLHRIQGLSENFVYFNDDMFITKTMLKTDFFKDNLPCDMAVLDYVATSNDTDDIFPHILLNNISVLNKHFDKKRVMSRNPSKWFSYKYGIKLLIKNLLMSPYNTFPAVSFPHMPSPFLKSTFNTVWEKEFDLLDRTSSHKFRNIKDINQYLIKEWQIASGNFQPKNIHNMSKVFGDIEVQKNDVKDAIIQQKFSMICINDTADINDFKKVKQSVAESFETILPNKSSFEL